TTPAGGRSVGPRAAGALRPPARRGRLRRAGGPARAAGPGRLPPRLAPTPRRRGRLPGSLFGTGPQGGRRPLARVGRRLAVPGRLPAGPQSPRGRAPPPRPRTPRRECATPRTGRGADVGRGPRGARRRA